MKGGSFTAALFEKFPQRDVFISSKDAP